MESKSKPLINILSSFRVLEVLKELSTKPKTKNELKNTLDISSSSLAQILSKVYSGMIEQNGDIFRILPKGEFILRIQETVKCQGKNKNTDKKVDYCGFDHRGFGAN